MKRMGKEDFERLFKKLDDELKYTGTRVQLYVFGGAAVALGYNDERVTTDVDAIITTDERSVLMRAIGKVGREEDIGQGWLNDAGTASVPKRPDLGQQTVFAGHNLSVKIAGRRHLTAMKLGGRPRDRPDGPESTDTTLRPGGAEHNRGDPPRGVRRHPREERGAARGNRRRRIRTTETITRDDETR